MDTEELLKDTKMKRLAYASMKKAVLLKTERLSSAVHLVTSLIDTRESVRWELRSLSVNVVRDFNTEKMAEEITKILSLLEVGRIGHLVSPMNYRILKEEYLRLREVVEKNLSEGKVDLEIVPKQLLGTGLELPRFSQVSLKDSARVSDTKKRTPIERGLGTKGKEKDVRQDLIAGAIKDNRGYSIKDIIGHLKSVDPHLDCSSKTIQRDLLELVMRGELIKSGERRWSTYSRPSA